MYTLLSFKPGALVPWNEAEKPEKPDELDEIATVDDRPVDSQKPVDQSVAVSSQCRGVTAENCIAP